MDHICYLCFVFCHLSCLLIAAVRSSAGKGLASWLSCLLCFIVFLSLSHVLPWVRCDTRLYRFLIFASLLTLVLSTVTKNVLNMANSTDPDETPRFGFMLFINAPFKDFLHKCIIHHFRQATLLTCKHNMSFGISLLI